LQSRAALPFENVRVKTPPASAHKPCGSPTARAGNRHFGLLSAVRARTQAQCKNPFTVGKPKRLSALGGPADHPGRKAAPSSPSPAPRQPRVKRPPCTCAAVGTVCNGAMRAHEYLFFAIVIYGARRPASLPAVADVAVCRPPRAGAISPAYSQRAASSDAAASGVGSWPEC
jgi:hypothetical protein